jgi:GT2 family glycosyltransferase
MTGISIIVPTHGRADLVGKLLASLWQTRQRLGENSEVLIVDSSPPEEAALIRQRCSEWSADYHTEDNDVRRKRNFGIQKARFNLLFFTDSDCEVDADVLSQHWTAQAGSGPAVAAVAGLTEWCGPESAVWKVLTFNSSFTAAFSFATWLPELPWATCTNLSVRREAAVAVGGFDETSPLRVYGEDVDFGIRLCKEGYRIVGNPKALVWHHRETLSTFGAAARKALSTGRADYYLGVRHPDRLALEFPLPIVMVCLLVAVGAVKAALEGEPPWLVGAAAVWLAAFLTAHGLLSALAQKDRIRNVPFRMLAGLLDLAFELGQLWEAVRHGRPARAWTKFVYVEQQLAAERLRRVVQMWSLALGFLLILLWT